MWFSPCCRDLSNPLAWIRPHALLRHSHTLRLSSASQIPYLFESDLPVVSRLQGYVCLEIHCRDWRKIVKSSKAARTPKIWMSLALLLLFYAPTLWGQGSASETAPPLFPGGGLVSYNSVFTTRGSAPGSTDISATACPTFLHEANFNFTWGFHRNFDLTVLVPVVTSHFNAPGASTVGGTGLGDAMLLVKCRFLRHDSPRGTTQASFAIRPKLPTGPGVSPICRQK